MQGSDNGPRPRDALFAGWQPTRARTKRAGTHPSIHPSIFLPLILIPNSVANNTARRRDSTTTSQCILGRRRAWDVIGSGKAPAEAAMAMASSSRSAHGGTRRTKRTKRGQHSDHRRHARPGGALGARGERDGAGPGHAVRGARRVHRRCRREGERGARGGAVPPVGRRAAGGRGAVSGASSFLQLADAGAAAQRRWMTGWCGARWTNWCVASLPA
ncbi:hypothetical protein B0H15DRAFT_656070 [Mycena belliarum]|uniref:Uncharacterized protein n=1 Tax=Mycena belliarum TaxID=1033014 RepID=A0AAD6TR67_9AGAR|nr:hypothetical protein B0H15DRAFT_656070 [Mycena belliae]